MFINIIAVGVDTWVEFYLPVMNKYGDYKIYCPNQDTLKVKRLQLTDTPRRGPNQNALGNLVLLQAVIL